MKKKELNSIYSEKSDVKLPKDIIPLKNPIICDKGYIIGTVYCFKNSINNKLYIGETVKRNFRSRFIEHCCHSKYGNSYFYKAIRKYGWDNFDRMILYQTEELEDTLENEQKLNNLVNNKEQEYIKLFNTTDYSVGYNLTGGGDGVLGYKFSEESKKKMSESHKGEKHWNYGNYNNSTSDIVMQFDLNFNFIKEWPSMAEIGRKLGYRSNNISRCCNNILNTYKGFIWVKKDDYYDGYLQKHKSRAKCKSSDKIVLQYTTKGEFISEYISASEAARQLNCDKSTISGAARGKFKWAKKFIWIYKKDFTEGLLQEKIKALQ